MRLVKLLLLLISGMLQMLRSGSVEWKVINTRRTRQVAPSEFLPRLKITSSINPPTISLVERSSSLANLNPDTGCCNFETSRINFNLPCFFHNGLLLLLLLHILNISQFRSKTSCFQRPQFNTFYSAK